MTRERLARLRRFLARVAVSGLVAAAGLGAVDLLARAFLGSTWS